MSDALNDLIKQVEAGAWDGSWSGVLLVGLTGPDLPLEDFSKAYHGSLDAAKALHEALLPGWDMAMMSMRKTKDFAALVSPPGMQGEYDWRKAPSAARAWLVAILYAVRAKA